MASKQNPLGPEEARAPADFRVRTTEKACAKVNLYLQIVGRRPDGYHLIDSLFVFLAIGDELTISDAPKLTLELDGPFAFQLGDNSGNLVMTAAERLARISGVERGAALKLTKNLPVAAGLGGGSSDAAAALRGLRTHWDLALTDSELMDMALDLGADVPACVVQSSALVSGVGEVVQPIAGLPEFWMVLVNPGVELSTAQVFAAYKDSGRALSIPAPLDAMPDRLEGVIDELAARGNDLELAACGLAPAVAEVLTELQDFKDSLIVRMSGSGATCFALFATEAAAEKAATALAGRHPDWWVAYTQPNPAET